MQKRLIISSFALSRKGKYRHSFTPQRRITSQNTFPAVKIDLGGTLPVYTLSYSPSAVI